MPGRRASGRASSDDEGVTSPTPDPWAAPDRPATSWGAPTGEAPAGTRTWSWLTTDVLVIAIAGLLVLFASSSLAVARLAGDEPVDLTAAQAELERRLPDLIAYVEQERGLTFTEPVDARVLDDERFLDALYSGGSEDEQDDEEEGDAGATLTALGLLDPDDDLDEVVDEALGEGVVGFYDQESDELFVRGTSIDPYVQMVLVHELVHALQDQRFDLDRPELRDADDERFSGFQSLVEGDATRVETAWYDSRPDDLQAAIDAEEQRRFAGSDRQPGVVDLLLGFPYFAGQPYVEALLESGGQARLDAAFRTPPTTTEQVLQPDADDLEPVEVETPIGKGKRVDQGVLGAAGLSLLVPADPTQDGPHLGWDGDRYATFTDGDETCTVVAVVLESTTARDDLDEELSDWRQRTGATVTVTGDRALRLESCAG